MQKSELNYPFRPPRAEKAAEMKAWKAKAAAAAAGPKCSGVCAAAALPFLKKDFFGVRAAAVHTPQTQAAGRYTPAVDTPQTQAAGKYTPCPYAPNTGSRKSLYIPTGHTPQMHQLYITPHAPAVHTSHMHQLYIHPKCTSCTRRQPLMKTQKRNNSRTKRNPNAVLDKLLEGLARRRETEEANR